jgi:hypothetical protein
MFPFILTNNNKKRKREVLDEYTEVVMHPSQGSGTESYLHAYIANRAVPLGIKYPVIDRQQLEDMRVMPEDKEHLELLITLMVWQKMPSEDNQYFIYFKTEDAKKYYTIVIEWPEDKPINYSNLTAIRNLRPYNITGVDVVCRGERGSLMYPNSAKSYISVAYSGESSPIRSKIETLAIYSNSIIGFPDERVS